VLIAGGSYEEAVGVADGVSLFGGYKQDFTQRDETQFEVIISSGEERTVTASNLTMPTKLDRLTIHGAILAGDDGRSSYAVWVRDTADKLTLSKVHVVAGKGANGSRGADGQPTTCDARGGQGGESRDCGSSTGGDGNASGDPVHGGKGQRGGDNNCPSACPLVGSDGITAGTSGEPGLPGPAGAGGKAATDSLGTFQEGVFQGTLGTPGQRGYHGTGGGGGGSGGTKKIRACFGCGTLLGGRGGDGAPGGCGGGGGAPGNPGGGAFALTLVNAKVVLEDSLLEGGEGGKGGPGGDGIPGGEGGQNTGNGHGDAVDAKCGLIWYHSGAGGIGGSGGHGRGQGRPGWCGRRSRSRCRPPRRARPRGRRSHGSHVLMICMHVKAPGHTRARDLNQQP
jgi:hypothetical protein